MKRVRESLKSICWDGCGFSKAVMMDPATWNAVLKRMVKFKRWLVSQGVQGAGELNLHLSLWPFIFSEEAIDFETALGLVQGAICDGETFDGVDIFVADHLDVNADRETVLRYGQQVRDAGLLIGDMVAPVWPFKGGGSAITADGREKFVDAFRKTCGIAQIFEQEGMRKHGCIRIDSATTPAEYRTGSVDHNFDMLCGTYQAVSVVGTEFSQVIAAEGEISAAGHHGRTPTVKLFRELRDRGVSNIGFQSDDAHVLTFVAGLNSDDGDSLLPPGVSLSDADFETLNGAVAQLGTELGQYVVSHHIAASDGDIAVPTAGHDYTGKHCVADDFNDKVTFAQSSVWVTEVC